MVSSILTSAVLTSSAPLATFTRPCPATFRNGWWHVYTWEYQYNSSLSRDTCYQAWRLEFDPHSLHGRRKSAPESCSLTFIHTHAMACHSTFGKTVLKTWKLEGIYLEAGIWWEEGSDKRGNGQTWSRDYIYIANPVPASPCCTVPLDRNGLE